MSGNWVGSPSLMMEKRWRPAATGYPAFRMGGRLVTATSVLRRRVVATCAW